MSRRLHPRLIFLRSPECAQPSLEGGFSLIELLIVLACVSVLTHLAWPTYAQWQQRSQRSQARVALMQVAQWLERSAAANGQYPKPEEVPANVWSTHDLRYHIQADLSATRFTLMAVPDGAQAGDACGSLTFNHLGEQGVQQATLSAADCWQR